MVIGDHLVHLNDVRLTFKHLKLECGKYIGLTLISVIDAQNVDVVLKIISDNYFMPLKNLKLLNPSISTLHDKNALEARLRSIL